MSGYIFYPDGWLETEALRICPDEANHFGTKLVLFGMDYFNDTGQRWNSSLVDEIIRSGHSLNLNQTIMIYFIKFILVDQCAIFYFVMTYSIISLNLILI